MLFENGVCYDQHVLLTELCLPLPCFILYSKANFSFFDISGWGIDLDYCDVDWFALERN